MSDLNIVPEVPEDAQAQSTQPVPTPAELATPGTSVPDAIPATPQISGEETATPPNDTATAVTTADLATPAASVPDATPAALQLPIEEAPATDTPSSAVEPKPKTRIFKIGATRIVADVNTAQLDNEQVRTFLKPTYPEVASAAIRETNLDANTIVLEFLAQLGRKG
jgi:Prokaryotic Ubiquitin